ncbi:MAG: hypothetical protein ACD_2C00014G0004 [uncultured bacterium (gcode 4)]|uniref:Uncharacterized protein n=1 Tax=uncultured bacterium (gcode 4) TaxID=1234023 RepID=K2H348_9BACT|nr:MAG: hypothetical protein ACD_2C00014G0004 [uncultured bacterium (gcode 4)]
MFKILMKILLLAAVITIQLWSVHAEETWPLGNLWVNLPALIEVNDSRLEEGEEYKNKNSHSIPIRKLNKFQRNKSIYSNNIFLSIWSPANFLSEHTANPRCKSSFQKNQYWSLIWIIKNQN